VTIRVTPVAKAIPFDNATNGYVAQDVQEAIEESKADAIAVARYSIFCAYEANANTGRWLEFTRGNASDGSPYIIVGNTTLEELTLVTSDTTATGTVTVFKNAVALTTISLAAEKVKISINAFVLSSLDQLSLQVTSGSIQRPQVQLFLRKND